MKDQILERILTGTAERLVQKNVNSACLWALFQPKLPKEAEKFKKR